MSFPVHNGQNDKKVSFQPMVLLPLLHIANLQAKISSFGRDTISEKPSLHTYKAIRNHLDLKKIFF
jgi:hypothetical protein